MKVLHVHGEVGDNIWVLNFTNLLQQTPKM